MPKIAPKLASKPTTTAPTSTSTSPTSPPLPSPPVPTSEPGWLTGSALKAAHEHTYATQRAKKAADRAKSKAPPRKIPSDGRSSSSSASTGPALSSSPSRTAAMTALWAEVWDARKIMTTEDLDWPELSRWSSPASPAPIEYAALRPTQDREVSLSAFVRPVKAKAKSKEGEFEFLPPVKNVIVLDDAESNVPSEPWEYVSSVGGDDEARKIFSYAEIVSKST